jgi:hypothetical protein
MDIAAKKGRMGIPIFMTAFSFPNHPFAIRQLGRPRNLQTLDATETSEGPVFVRRPTGDTQGKVYRNTI